MTTVTKMGGTYEKKIQLHVDHITVSDLIAQRLR